MFVLVLVEVLYVSRLEDDGVINEQFFWSLGISAAFFLELTLRAYVFCHTYGSLLFKTPTGNFFTNPFRAIDIALVIVDILFLIITFVVLSGQDDEDSVETKGGVKFARVARLAKYVKSLRWIRVSKMTRSRRVFANVRHLKPIFDAMYAQSYLPRTFGCYVSAILVIDGESMAPLRTANLQSGGCVNRRRL